MSKKYHVIVPNADTVIILKNPNATFAPLRPTLARWTRDDEVWYYVSGGNLKTASTVFARMLSGGNWKEGVPDEIDGLHHVTTEDWDSDALLYFLLILHHRNRDVPRGFPLEKLAKIAVINDYYKCTEALDIRVEIWVAYLRQQDPVPSKFCRDLMLWMCIAHSFELHREIEQTIAVAARRESPDLPTFDLPIVAYVDTIEDRRKSTVDSVQVEIQDLLDHVRSKTYTCPRHRVASYLCGYILHRTLKKQLATQGLLRMGKESWSGMTIPGLYAKLQNIATAEWHPSLSQFDYTSNQTLCDLREKIMQIADSFLGTPNCLEQS